MKSEMAVIYLAVTIAALSCSDLPMRSDGNVSDLRSEMVVLKKRLNLVEKKNALLEAENADDKNKIKRLKDDYGVLKGQSDKRIKELTELGNKQKTEFVETTNRMSDDIKKKEKDLTDRLARTMQAAAQKEGELSKTIDGLKKITADKDQLISQKENMVKNLEADMAGLKTELASRDNSVIQCDKKIKELVTEVETLKSELEKKDKLLKER